MINQLGPDTARMSNAIADNGNGEAVADENLKYSRAAAEANEYSSFVRQAALRLFSTDPGGNNLTGCSQTRGGTSGRVGGARILSYLFLRRRRFARLTVTLIGTGPNLKSWQRRLTWRNDMEKHSGPTRLSSKGAK